MPFFFFFFCQEESWLVYFSEIPVSRAGCSQLPITSCCKFFPGRIRRGSLNKLLFTLSSDPRAGLQDSLQVYFHPHCLHLDYIWDQFPFLKSAHFPLLGEKAYRLWVWAALSFCFTGQSQQISDAPRTGDCPWGHLEKELLEVSRALLTFTSQEAECPRDYCSACTCALGLATHHAIVCLCCPSKHRKDVQCFLELDKPKISLN